MNPEQEAICQAIDQRHQDKLAVRMAELSLEPKPVYWTGEMHLSSNKIILRYYGPDYMGEIRNVVDLED